MVIAAIQAQSQTATLISNWVEFYRAGQRIDAKSPDGKSIVSLLPPVNDDADPTMLIESDGKALRLGKLERSALIFWRSDSSAVAIADQRYSNHFIVRLVRLQPKLQEVEAIDKMIRHRVLQEFHTASFAHYWPEVKGWTRDGHLLVVTCADGPPASAPNGQKLLGFKRGYLVDANKLAIASELSPAGYTKLIGTDVCE